MYVHNIPKAKDARFIKDSFGTAVVDFFDIDADISAFLITKKLLPNFSFDEYFSQVLRFLSQFPMTKHHQESRLWGSLVSILLSEKTEERVIVYPEVVHGSYISSMVILLKNRFLKVDLMMDLGKSIPEKVEDLSLLVEATLNYINGDR